MTPVEALERVMHCLDRAFDSGHRVKAFSRALDIVRTTDAQEIEDRAKAGTLADLPGIGDATAKIITEALAGDVPAYLAKLELETVLVMTDPAAAIRAALRGDCHMHSKWSDGGATIEAMATTARSLGHEYMVLTDHSPRLTIAHGLSPERLSQQMIEVAEMNERLAPFRILTGMEVDILENGSLDLADELLAQLDVVVASVHSKLSMPSDLMTPRMMLAVASPHVDVLGHCTGRHLPKRGQSAFDADFVFAACAKFGTAVEINCRPERLDPPPDLMEIAMSHGCEFMIDSDAHATGQLEWLPHGCEIAAAADVPLDRIVNTCGLDDLLAWARADRAA
jgi:putative hydrolase